MFSFWCYLGFGHARESVLRNYLRDIGGMLPKDYGEDYTLIF
ncbi:hypothetical protein [Flavobacterium collinsii]|nr:hypothetical protein [Flavobacterium collinsii]